MLQMIPVLLLILVCQGKLTVQDEDLVPFHDFLVAAKLPPGYESNAKDIKDGEKTLGKIIVVSKPDQVSKVIVRIELRNSAQVAARRASTKAYVNELAETLASSGYKATEKKLPDISKEIFDKPVSVGIVFANGEGKKLLTHQEIFFTDKGFVVQVIAEDAQFLKDLTTWAKTIKPKPMP